MSIRGALLVWAHFLPSSACITEFKTNPDFLDYSGYAFKVARGEAIPEQVKEFFYMRHDPYVIQLTKYAMFTHQMLTACWAVGGRVWEVRLMLNQTLHADDGSEGLHTTACAPRSCRGHQVLQHIALKVITRDFDAVAPGRLRGVVRPLSSWRFVKLRFAIVGMGGCGTTSLQKNLKQHADIRFTRRDDKEET